MRRRRVARASPVRHFRGLSVFSRDICGGVFSASAIALVENIANAKIQAIVFFIAGFISFI